MRRRTKIIAVLAVIAAAIGGFGAWNWFNRPPRPIVVAEAGTGGERITLGNVPANFYPGSGDGPRPAVLLLSGSEGGIKEYRNAYARALAAKGYSVLYPGYFETSEANRAFNEVPLETFDRALAWLAAREDVDPARIAVIGHSKGAEAALLVASRHPELAAVVAAMPSDVVWQGFDFSSSDFSKLTSSWTAGGKPLVYVPYIVPAWYEWITGGQGTLAKMYRESWDRRAEYQGAAIPLEQIEAPVLAICGGKDEIWPSCPMARAAEARTKGMTLLAYEDAGHWGFGLAEGLDAKDERLLGRLGGSREADLAARRDQWPKVLAFLEQSLDSAGGAVTAP